ncbi:OmpA family protein [Marinifilum caeruleilacunae]|uniref:OmpA family protein n=1 Tax=Marinifilum caeruleilacunae TaxID=2499076 RepID=A0ABX1WSI1_9BACT|nr:OmpA family protein [Marinifilum caeruleilacunae]NOU58942.1 OmpA family protein [Marinifilum caeruleilacunae]
MKKFYTRTSLLILLAMLTTFHVNAQNADEKWGLGIYANFNSYKGDLGNGFWTIEPRFPVIGAASLSRYLNSSFDAEFKLSVFNSKYKKEFANFDDWLVNTNLNLRYKFNNGYILDEDVRISPFLVGGFGSSFVNAEGTAYGNYFDRDYINLNFYYGAGIKFRIDERWSILLETGIFYPLNDKYDGVKSKKRDTEMYHDKFMQNSIGVVYSFGASSDSDGDGVSDNRDECPNTPSGVQVDKNGCPIDTDGDGVPDYKDECPMLAGSALLNGCPDSDGDGVPDKDDKCPNVKGEVQFAGCPDTDGDGVPDAEDECPDVKGLKSLNGCPDSDGDGVPDKDDQCPNTKPGYKVDANGCAFDDDNDGVVNEEDKCPNVAGPASNYGCPEIKAEVKKELEFAAKNVHFASGRDALTAKSKKILDEVARIMNEHPAYSLKIAGYTDSQGKDEMNLKLSDKRAQATKAYLISKGISSAKIDAKGFGEANPIADNTTAAGRALNRRVEFELNIK